LRSVHLLVVGVSLAIAACNSGQAAGPGNGRGRGRGGPAVQVETATISRTSIERHADLSGTLVSPDQAKVSSEVAGIVREVPVQLGTEIRAGDTLVRLEPRELSLALERADSALKQVEAQLGLTRSDSEQVPPDEEVATVRQAAANRDDAKAAYDRAQQLNGRGLLSKVDRDTAETRMKVMEANYQAALDNVRALRATLQDRRASYDLAVKKLNDAVIKAPVAGSVSERLVQPGEFIRENTQVVTIVQMNPLKLRTSSSHQEGCEREFAVATKNFTGENGQVTGLNVVRVNWSTGADGRPQMEEIAGSEFHLKADLVLLAMGFVSPMHKGVVEELGVELDPRGNVKANDLKYATSKDKVFVAGDARRGQSLVVWAIREGRQCARAVDEFLMGASELPR